MANRLFQLKEQLNKMDLMKKMGVYLNEDLRPDIEAEIKLLEQEQLNKNKKLKKNNHKLIIETDDETEKIENELSKKLIENKTSDIQDNTIKQLSEKGLKENNISNIYPEMATHTYTPVNVTDVKVGDYIQFDYETRDRKTGDGVMNQSVGWVTKVTPKLLVIYSFQYKKEKLHNLQIIQKIELANVD